MTVHEQLVEEANYQTNQHKAGAPVVQCITVLNRAAAHVAALESQIRLLREECGAWRDWESGCGVDPHDCQCDDVPRGPNLIKALAAVDAAGALVEKARNP